MSYEKASLHFVVSKEKSKFALVLGDVHECVRYLYHIEECFIKQ